MQTFVVLRKVNANWLPSVSVRQQPYWDEHAEFMDALFEAGHILLGGPFDDGSGALLIIKAESEPAAQTMFDNDPWTLQNIQVNAEVKAWQIFLNAYQ